MKKEISKNLVIVNIELNEYTHDFIGNEIPVSYQVTFNFYGEEILAVFSIENLKSFLNYNEYLDTTYVETSSDLLDSFDDKLDDPNVATAICSELEDFWHTCTGDYGIYDYLGGFIVYK